MGEFEIELLNLEDALGGLDGNLDEINLEIDRHNKFCDLNDTIANVEIATRVATEAADIILRKIETGTELLGETWDYSKEMAETTKCVKIVGTANGTDCDSAILAKAELTSEYTIKTIATLANLEATNVIEGIKSGISLGEAKWKSRKDCDYDEIDSNVTIKILLSNRASLALEALKAEYRVRLAIAKISGLRDKADRLISQQAETEQLAINIEAARNNPNVRIYKNDSIINADRAFYAAIKEAYKATKVLEYYTSMSYEKLTNLFLIRMVSYGDYNLENYLHELYEVFVEFEESYGNPDNRLAIYSLKNDILNIPRMDTNGKVYSENERNTMLHEKLLDGSLFDKNGYVVIPFKTSLTSLSPITFNHKIKYLEAEMVGNNLGDVLGRVYVKQKGTSAVRPSEGNRLYYLFPERTAVINTIFNGDKWYTAVDLFKNDKFRDRPFVNTNYELVINTMDEFVNKDIDLSDINDIKVYIYYTDFTSY